MHRSSSSPARRRFGNFELDLRAGELRKEGRPLKLRGQPIQLLELLLENPGEVVTREELKERIWPADTFVDFDHSLNNAVNKLREVLGDSPQSAQFVETVPRRGYRFIGALQPLSEAPEPTRNDALRRRVLGFALAVTALAIVSVIAFFLRDRPATGKIMLAVLPFANLSGDPAQEYFSDGLTEEMITQLGRLDAQRLGIIARTSVMHYKNATKRVDEIGRELGVDYVLEGSVRRQSDRVRITAQLIRAKDQTHLWAEDYERDVRDLLTLENDVAAAVANEVQLKLISKDGSRPAVHRPLDPYAHEQYLLGRFNAEKRTPEGIRKSVEHFQAAVNADPLYALAWVGLSDSYRNLAAFGGEPVEEADAKARAAAKRALEIDDNLGEAHASMAVLFREDCNWQAAERELHRALQLNPNYATAHRWLATYFSSVGKHDEAIREISVARQLDPLSPVIRTVEAMILFNARKYDEVIKRCEDDMEFDPSFHWFHAYLGAAYVEKSMFAEGIAEYEREAALSKRDPNVLARLGYAYARAGRPDRALEIARELEDLSKRRYVPPTDVALVYVGLRDHTQAFAWLDKASRDAGARFTMSFLKVSPWYDGLRDDPRYIELLRRMNFL